MITWWVLVSEFGRLGGGGWSWVDGGVWIATDTDILTLFKFSNNLAYSSKTSCSSGLRLSSPSDICEAPKFGSVGAGSEAMVYFLPFCFVCNWYRAGVFVWMGR